jgi:hypothetical protein
VIKPTAVKTGPGSSAITTSLPSSGNTTRSSDQLKTELGEDGANPSSLNASPLSADDVSAKLREMHQEIAALRREVKRQGDTLDGLRRPEPVHGSVDDAVLETVKAEEEYRQELDNQRVAERLLQVDDVFLAESSDPNWSGEAELAVDSAANSLRTKGTDVLSLDCRTSLCRLEVAYNEQTAQIEFETALPSELAELTPGMTIDSAQTDDGYITSVIYLVRAGYDLP